MDIIFIFKFQIVKITRDTLANNQSRIARNSRNAKVSTGGAGGGGEGCDGLRCSSHRLLMKLNPLSLSPLPTFLKHLSRRKYTMPSSISQTLAPPAGSQPELDFDDHLCSEQEERKEYQISSADSPSRCLTGESRIERAWAHWKKLGQPKFIVAPMVDNSELPFRMLCRKYGAQAAYTPMLHSRIFSENEKYRSQEFTTCKVFGNFRLFRSVFMVC